MGMTAELAGGDDHPGMTDGKGRGMADIAKDADIAFARLFQIGDVMDKLIRTLRLGQLGTDRLRQEGQSKWPFRLEKTRI
jgi:hypothetical protein